MLSPVMKTDYIKLNPKNTIKEALDLIIENKLNGAPVLSENNKLVGIIVKADIYRFLMEEGHYDSCPVDWVMTKKVITVDKSEDLIAITKVLRDNEIHAVPVLDGEEVIGMITLENIIDYYLERK